MNERITPLDVWFSYSGKQQPLVKTIVETMNAMEVTLIQEALKADEEKNWDDVKQARFTPKRYQHEDDSDNSKIIYRLPPTGNINLLVKEIAKSFLKVIVLSPEYFQSDTCLRELCLSLSAFHTSEGHLPMFLLDGFDDTSEVFLNGSFDFKISASDELKGKTLQEALIEVHKRLDPKMWELARDFDLSEEFRKNLPTQLDKLSSCIYAVSQMSPEEIVREIYRYGFSSLKELNQNYHPALMESLYNDWKKRPYPQKLLARMEDGSDGGMSFSAIQSPVGAGVYLSQVLDVLDDFYSELVFNDNKAEESVMQLCGMVVLKVYDSMDAALLSYFGNVNSILGVKVLKNSDPNFNTALHTAIAFSLACGNNIKLQTPNGDLKGTKECDYVKGAILPHKTGITANTRQVEYVFQELVKQLLPHNGKPTIDLDAIRKDKDLIGQIRAQLQIFEVASKQKNLRAMARAPYAFLALKEVIKTNVFSPVLKSVEDILNEGYDEKVHIPCIVIQEESRQTHKANYTIQMSQEISNMIFPKLQEISNMFNQNRQS
ncbi:hypothetical protein KIH87_03980 [Paraneptunicella aestuarii]|uniref:hypothetical protein n=1 Tax=Paraneptunicella aestuarii TaxID=2831148 RepID=UPI001E3F958D|nr:hypothetical protein [Paraneptunicella aestuarii]UAA39525.1 hypothetical protein KIH87_03980 [Paraneptunicella aestuarii]